LTFRAFSPLNEKRLKQLLRILKKGGSIIAYKGRRELIEKEAALGESLGLTYRIVEVSVPFLEEPRHLLWFNSSS
ncbi:MAG: class I SAM-dependent methyltransferase, partial [Spirochaetales bacterium]|nr:class I SAM-dependent methyltransferase [Spirochaetales bacterium]